MVSHSPDRTRELLNHALRALACGSGDLAARLKNAHSDALIQFLGGTTEMESVSEELRDLMEFEADKVLHIREDEKGNTSESFLKCRLIFEQQKIIVLYIFVLLFSRINF